MNKEFSIIDRCPSPAEYLELIAAVGWRPRERRAVEVALAASLYAVCAVVDQRVVGCGRVIGDGGLHLYLSDVVVTPTYQRHGIGTAIVGALMRHVELVPYANVLAAVLPTPGLVAFYARHGFRPQSAETPILQRWINRSDDQPDRCA
jgi:GNAT superfamily N-acetyltransferase